MKKLLNFEIVFLLFSLLTGVQNMLAQSAPPQGINYQGIARNSSNAIIASQPIRVKVGVYAPTVSGTLEWEETHAVSTNQLGLFYFVIGQGTTTGAGTATSFSAINWEGQNHFLKIAMDETGGTSFTDIDTIQFWSVPYAMYSGKSGSLLQSFRLNQLSDVDSLGIFSGSVLKWNGIKWVPMPDNDSDTVGFAYTASFSNTSDTAAYALNVLSSVDTVPFAYNSDSAAYSLNSGSSSSSVNSQYCDTAVYAYTSGNVYSYWNLNGNTGTNPLSNFLGTIDNKDLVIKTNGIERARVTASGRVGIGTSSPIATLHVIGNDGLVAEGTYGSGAVAPSGVGTRLVWNPKKGAFRAGGVTGTQWDDANIGAFSFATGYNTRASGAYSTAFGSGSVASGLYSIAACEGSTASGNSSIAMGSIAIATGAYSVALGRAAEARDTGAIAMGYHNTATGKYALSFGYQTRASGDYSVVMGYYANANGKRGSFVFADNSSSSPTLSTIDNQFMARASGGVVFYSNTAMTTGVSLPAGGGAWATLSDKNKKENFRQVNKDSILAKIDRLEITSWNYKTQNNKIRHIGPMAQDFYSIFQYGEGSTTITTVDMDGVSLAAIQALDEKTKQLFEKAEEIKKLKMILNKLEAQNKLLEKRIEEMEAKVSTSGKDISIK